MGVQDDRDCPRCGAETTVCDRTRRCTDDDCIWYLRIGGVSA